MGKMVIQIQTTATEAERGSFLERTMMAESLLWPPVLDL
jgi:hypothetical protein